MTVETLGMRNVSRSPCSPVKQRVILVQFSFVYKCVLFYVAVVISGYIGLNGRNVLKWKGCSRKRSWCNSGPMSSCTWCDWGNLHFAPQEVIAASVYAYLVRCGGLLAIRGSTGVLLVGATDSFISTHRLQTSRISSRMQWASAACGNFRNGQ
jgi:hypothetical protein